MLVLLHHDWVLVTVCELLGCLSLLSLFLLELLSKVVELLPDPLLNVKQRTVVTALTLHIGGSARVLVRLYAWLRVVLGTACQLLLSVPFHDVV